VAAVTLNRSREERIVTANGALHVFTVPFPALGAARDVGEEKG